MDGAMPRETIHTLESVRPDCHVEVALPAFLKPCMTAMAFAVVQDLKLSRCERRAQSVFYFLLLGHFFRGAPSF